MRIENVVIEVFEEVSKDFFHLVRRKYEEGPKVVCSREASKPNTIFRLFKFDQKNRGNNRMHKRSWFRAVDRPGQSGLCPGWGAQLPWLAKIRKKISPKNQFLSHISSYINYIEKFLRQKLFFTKFSATFISTKFSYFSFVSELENIKR